MNKDDRLLIDVINLILTHKPYLREQINIELKNINAVEEIFTNIFKSNAWGSGESVSGNGSTVAYTTSMRSLIGQLFDKYGIDSIFDAPCGDFNWMKLVLKDRKMKYYGADIVKDLITSLSDKYASDNINFYHLDLLTGNYPETDLMLCRDCLFHLSFQDIKTVLQNFANSKIKYLLTTNMYNNEGFLNTDIQTGGFRKIDLFLEPFLLPINCVDRIDDSHESEQGTKRELVLWDRSQILSRLNSL